MQIIALNKKLKEILEVRAKEPVAPGQTLIVGEVFM